MSTEPTYYETSTHRHMPMFASDGKTKRFEYVAVVHKTRSCDNCSADGLRDEDFSREGGVEQFGRCMNGFGVANADAPSERWCDEHQTPAEFKRGLKRPDRHVLDLASSTERTAS